jgi:hypothetical protein
MPKTLDFQRENPRVDLVYTVSLFLNRSNFLLKDKHQLTIAIEYH